MSVLQSQSQGIEKELQGCAFFLFFFSLEIILRPDG